MMRSSLPLSLLLLAAGPLLAPARAQEAGKVELDLKSEIDAGVRWLRAQQSPDGSYGGGVTGTAWVLQALAGSPRAYRRHHGPFVRGALDYLAAHQDEEGHVHDADAERNQGIEQSLLALLALRQFDDETTRPVRARLAACFEAVGETVQPEALAREEAERLAIRWIARRRADHSWDGADGPIVETARALIDLSRAWRALEPAPAPKARRALPPFDPADRAGVERALQRGALFLVAASENGRWGPPGEPEAGMTAMALSALQALPEPRPEAVQAIIDGGLSWLVSLQKPDGSIHDGKLANYITSASVLALARAGRAEHAPVIARARDFLVALQADEGEGYSEGDLHYGGIGYGNDERPDLSNLQMALEALSAAGLEQGDETFRKALRFLERTQNRSESNDVSIREGEVVIESGDDGGAAYAPGESNAGFEVLADGTKVPRSYGSMTYALLKGFIFAGLPKEDARMQAAWKWVREHYTLDVNPGFERSPDPSHAYQGLYYYFHTMAKALDLYGEESVVDAQGVAHAWRAQLCGRLIAMQRKDDGSWLNENAARWWEGNPVLATSYAMLTLGTALPPAREAAEERRGEDG